MKLHESLPQRSSHEEVWENAACRYYFILECVEHVVRMLSIAIVVVELCSAPSDGDSPLLIHLLAVHNPTWHIGPTPSAVKYEVIDRMYFFAGSLLSIVIAGTAYKYMQSRVDHTREVHPITRSYRYVAACSPLQIYLAIPSCPKPKVLVAQA